MLFNVFIFGNYFIIVATNFFSFFYELLYLRRSLLIQYIKVLFKQCHHLVWEWSVEQTAVYAGHVFNDIKEVLPLDCLIVIFWHISIKWIEYFNVERDLLIKLLNTFDFTFDLFLIAFLF